MTLSPGSESLPLFYCSKSLISICILLVREDCTGVYSYICILLVREDYIGVYSYNLLIGLISGSSMTLVIIMLEGLILLTSSQSLYVFSYESPPC